MIWLWLWHCLNIRSRRLPRILGMQDDFLARVTPLLQASSKLIKEARRAIEVNKRLARNLKMRVRRLHETTQRP
jgi:hypothetical protein